MCIISTETSSMLTTLIAANILSFDKQMEDLVASPSSRLFLPHHHNFCSSVLNGSNIQYVMKPVDRRTKTAASNST